MKRKNTAWANALLYTKADAEQARIVVDQLKGEYAKLTDADKEKYKSAYDAINSAWDKYDSSKVFYTYEQAAKVGQMAQELLKTMRGNNPNIPLLSQRPIGEESTTEKLFSDLTSTLAVFAVVAGTVYFLLPRMKNEKK